MRRRRAGGLLAPLVIVCFLALTASAPAHTQLAKWDAGVWPTDVTVGTGGVWVAGQSADGPEILKFDYNGVRLKRWTATQAQIDSGEFPEYPGELTVDSAGRVYVVDHGYSRGVFVFGAAGNLLLNFGESGIDPGDLPEPTGVAVGDDGSIYVGDQNRAKIVRFTPAGQFLEEWGFGYPGSPGQPHSLAFDSSGALFVAQGLWSADERYYVHDSVHKFGPDGNQLASWGGYPDDLGFEHVAPGPGGYVYAINWWRGDSIEMFDRTGKLRERFGFGEGGGLAVDSLGRVYAGDAQTAEIRKYGLDRKDHVAPVVQSLLVMQSSITYEVSERARLTFTVQRRLKGRKKKNGACVKRTNRNRNRPKCTRFTAVPGSFAHQGTMGGVNSFPFNRAVGGRPLAAGRYRLVAVARDELGNVGPAKRTGFSVGAP